MQGQSAMLKLHCRCARWFKGKLKFHRNGLSPQSGFVCSRMWGPVGVTLQVALPPNHHVLHDESSVGMASTYQSA
eukprot:1620736-Amphidinium_carterae.1